MDARLRGHDNVNSAFPGSLAGLEYERELRDVGSEEQDHEHHEDLGPDTRAMRPRLNPDIAIPTNRQ